MPVLSFVVRVVAFSSQLSERRSSANPFPGIQSQRMFHFPSTSPRSEEVVIVAKASHDADEQFDPITVTPETTIDPEEHTWLTTTTKKKCDMPKD